MSTATEELNLVDDETADDAPKNPGGEDRGDLVEAPKAAKKPAEEAGDDDDHEDGDDPEKKPAAAPAKAAKPMPDMIPKARFDEVNETAKELRAQNEALMKALAGKPADAAPAKEDKPAVVDLDALEEQYADALLDGDKAKAKGLRAQMREEELARAVAAATAAQSAVSEKQQFDAEVKAIHAEYPQLNHKGDAADAEAISEVIDWRNFLVATKGLPMHSALRQAADRVAKARGWDQKEDEPSGGADQRTVAQRRKNAQAALDQPPPMDGGVGERASRTRQMDVTKMSDKEFAELPESDKKRLRGD